MLCAKRARGAVYPELLIHAAIAALASAEHAMQLLDVSPQSYFLSKQRSLARAHAMQASELGGVLADIAAKNSNARLLLAARLIRAIADQFGQRQFWTLVQITELAEKLDCHGASLKTLRLKLIAHSQGHRRNCPASVSSVVSLAAMARDSRSRSLAHLAAYLFSRVTGTTGSEESERTWASWVKAHEQRYEASHHVRAALHSLLKQMESRISQSSCG
jgi:hypothetical protein